MDPQELFVDQRLLGCCVYCGAAPEARDHVPSKILLDDPLPPDLRVVEACLKCNSSFSHDEEYLACFLECVISGSTSHEALSREKIKAVLARKPSLAARIQSCCRTRSDGGLLWQPEQARVRNVVLKLACGHATFELSLPQTGEPDELHFVPLAVMADEDRAVFENAGPGELSPWPEVGSRAFFRACGAKPCAQQCGPWVVVQPGRYRYTVDQRGGLTVQMVLSEYLACSVTWR